MLKKLIFIIAACCVFATGALAQGFGGFGGGGGGAFLLGRDDVQTDLKLTDEQKTKLQDLRESTFSQIQQARQESSGDRDAMQKAMAPIMQKALDETNKILTPEQQTRLHQINMQVNSYSVLTTDKDLQTQLKMTPAQAAQIDSLQKQQQQANASVFQKMQSGEMQRQDAFAAFKKNTEALNSAIQAVLTPEQKTAWTGMLGKPFVATSNPFGRFGGGRPGGGGGGGR
ncbi:MAG TPA: hypothetical protein VG944_01720 [Fimbriimonas sp.]|nr:hypothetical protein [Fimbriimonas sp.]